MRVITAIGKAGEIGEVFGLVRNRARDLGAVRYSYHFTPIFGHQTSPETIFDSVGFPPGWVALYEDYNFRANDPIPQFIMKRGEPMIWSDAARSTLLENPDVDMSDFFRAAAKHGLEHGMSIPLFGPRSRNAYAAFGFDEPVTSVNDERCESLRTLIQAAHGRICRLLDDRQNPVALSPREKQVLKWIAQGKSNTDIAAILEIAPDTVATYVRRVFDKLETRDRVGATVKALQLGLITL